MGQTDWTALEAMGRIGRDVRIRCARATDTPLERVKPGKCLWSEPIGWIEMSLLFGHLNRPKKPKWHSLIGWKELRHGGCMRVYGYEVMAFPYCRG